MSKVFLIHTQPQINDMKRRFGIFVTEHLTQRWMLTKGTDSQSELFRRMASYLRSLPVLPEDFLHVVSYN